MANMSYCRFHNTNLDVQDCMEALIGLVDMYEEIDWLERNPSPSNNEELAEALDTYSREQLSADESRAAQNMIKSFLSTMWELGIIPEYSLGELSNLMAKISK